MKIKLNEHYRQIRFVLILVLVLNWAVALIKIAYGLMTKASSMTADGLHSLSDGASNIIGIIGIYVAARPVDDDHPYGHKKYETLFSLGIGVLLFIVAFNLAREGYEHLHHAITPTIDVISFVVMLVTLSVNIIVMAYEFKKGKALKSDILISDSMHTRADILTSVTVIVALIGVKNGYPMLDPIATMIISLFIAYSGFEIMKQGSQVLCDKVAILNVKEVEKIVLSVSGVAACHKIRTRGRTDDIYIDLHAQVKGDMQIQDAHKISYDIEDALKKCIAGVTDVVVHIEPLEKKARGYLKRR